MRIAIIGMAGYGQTFFDWSLNFLTGKNQTWHYTKGWVPLPDNPLTEKNAHGYTKNHPEPLDIDLFLEQSKDIPGMLSFYPVLVPKDTSVEYDPLPNGREFIDKLLKADVKIVFIKPSRTLYPNFGERGDRTEDDKFPLMTEWLQRDGTDWKTTREQFSLKMFAGRREWNKKAEKFYEEIESKALLFITQDEFLEQAEKHLIDFIGKVGLKVDVERLKQWQPVKKQWKEMLDGWNIWYDERLPKITEAIVENKPITMQDSEINLLRQTIIMHHLMKDHGRRLILPTDDFPLDTQILHGFLK